jgi:hypothetical protein
MEQSLSWETDSHSGNQEIPRLLWNPKFITVFIRVQSSDSSVGIALGYGLDDRDSKVRLPAEAGNFSLRHFVQNGSGAHPSSYPMGTMAVSLVGKATGAWSWPLTFI